MLVHSAVRQQDITFEWINNLTLEIKIGWPQWFLYAEQMASLTIDDEGIVQFPPEHPMTMDMSERNAALMEEDNNVYDYGFFCFEQPMVQTIDTFELLNSSIEFN
jgi:predicted ferric reductase